MNISHPLYADQMRKSAAHSSLFLNIPSAQEKPSLFDQLTSHLTLGKKDELDRTLKGQPPSKDYEHSLQTMMKQPLEETPSSNGILGIQSYPYYALDAAMKGVISEEDFYTLMLYYGAKQTLPPVPGHNHVLSIPLFSGDHPSKDATSLLSQTFKVSGRDDAFFISSSEMDLFLEKMKSQSPFEHQFFLIPDYPIELSGKRAVTSTEKNEKEFGFNVFGRVIVDGKRMRIVPSFGMMQAILDVRFGESAVKLDPIFSVVPTTSMDERKLNFLSGKFPFPIPFPSSPLPEKTDGSLSRGIDYVLAEFFQAFLTSSIPLVNRRQGLAFLEMIDIYSKQPPKDFQRIEKFYARFAYKMNSSYIECAYTRGKNLNSLFWQALDSSMMDEMEEEQTRKDLLKSVFRELIRNRQFYTQHYKLDIKAIFREDGFDNLKEIVEIVRDSLFRDVEKPLLKQIALHSDDPLLRQLARATLTKRIAERELQEIGRTSL